LGQEFPVPAASLTAHHVFQADQRRSRRDDVFFPTQLTLDRDGEQVEVQVVNISCHGFMARVEPDLPVGTLVTLDLPGTMPIAARIVWALGGRIGGEFRSPIPFERYGRVLETMSRASDDWQAG
jgi:hypothetical protein